MFARSGFALVLTASVALVLVGVTVALGGTPGENCRAGLYRAAGAYADCEQRALANVYAGGGGGSSAKFNPAFSKCRVKYTGVWAKLAARASGSGTPCAAARFLDDGSIVTDNLTGLQWEKKTEDASMHDKNNSYSWSATGTAADGTAYTAFLPTLNAGCFAGQCDWRLPTLLELQTILLEPFACVTSPCIDATFGPTEASVYWSSTGFGDIRFAWIVNFNDGGALVDFRVQGSETIRAVRGGLSSTM
jgi:hypothetical protein